ncbi:MAG: alpha/beta hydrolase [Gammaproteobacteria bacterium]|nr:alpha/beta hydrolase [Gammaproteobacteria bacterium]
MTSIRTRLLNLALRGLVKRDLARRELSQASIADLRTRLDRLAERASFPGDVQFTEVDAGGVRAEWTTPADPCTGNRVILYLHGGAYAFGSPKLYRRLTHPLAAAAGVRVLAPDYRLAPEHPYPAAPDDALAVYRHLLDAGHEADGIALAGDSAGGNLVLVLLQRIREAGLPLPASATCLSPWSDLTASGDSVILNAHRDPMLPADRLLEAADLYAPDADLRDPLISPLFADYRDFPPLLLHVGSTEILLDDATRVARAAERAGVRTDLRIWPAQPHVFHLAGPFLPEARTAVHEIARFVLTRWLQAEDRARQRVRAGERPLRSGAA